MLAVCILFSFIFSFWKKICRELDKLWANLCKVDSLCLHICDLPHSSCIEVHSPLGNFSNDIIIQCAQHDGSCMPPIDTVQQRTRKSHVLRGVINIVFLPHFESQLAYRNYAAHFDHWPADWRRTHSTGQCASDQKAALTDSSAAASAERPSDAAAIHVCFWNWQCTYV